ncbi:MULTISPECIES: glycosyltransferase family 2 protein [Flavobacteriaceae]|uniref:Glycosyltransferase family 2 protein n=2 Tax=Flavobacteriaceae TaxID=49546 RepID=A0A4Y8AVK4_9FLAO|nr:MULTISPECIES: glycosyltransferase family A protein [Flavobacteriaceae]TEW76576.1 glycosyltransferase family 2 protein [Gramella jeungdoensis]GGK60769.1 glycosyl transferase [Lutibacter litoralis]
MINSNVTAIIPCYNDEEYVLSAVNSILKQTILPEKIIVIDDGSDDITKAILSKINNDIIEVILQDNLGVCKARNKAIDLANTEYILTLDADDFFESTFIEKAIYILNNNKEVGIVGCHTRSFNSLGIELKINLKKGSTVNDLLFENKGASASSMYRKACWEQVGGYDEKMINGYEDWEFWIAIAKKNWKTYIIKEVLFNYRVKYTSRDSVARLEYDSELKEYIFLKHQELYSKNIEKTITYFFKRIKELEKRNNQLNKSIDYNLGKQILRPLRKLKNLISNKK